MQAEGQVDADGNITPAGAALGTMKDCGKVKGKTVCGYYQYLQGTSMASPHAAGVAALAVSAHGKPAGQVGLRPGARHGCGGCSWAPPPTTPARPRPPADLHRRGSLERRTTPCASAPRDFNSFYGDGIVNALGVVAKGHGHGWPHR